MSNHRTSKLATMAATAVLIALLGACGTDDDTPDAANTPEKNGKQSPASFDDWQLSFSDCLRGKGIDMPDPDPDGGIALDNAGDPAAFAAAAEECRDELGEPPAPEGGGDAMTDEEALADQLKVATCLREEGYDVADPEPGGGLTIPDDVPADAIETCAPNGISGPTAP